MRAFDINAVSLALGVTTKWLDNLLSHHHVAGVVGGRQGVRRLIRPHAVVRIAVAIRLIHELGVPVHRALRSADSIAADGRLTGELGFELRMDVPALARELDARLAEAAETAATRKRGRPRGASSDRRAIPQLTDAP